MRIQPATTVEGLVSVLCLNPINGRTSTTRILCDEDDCGGDCASGLDDGSGWCCLMVLGLLSCVKSMSTLMSRLLAEVTVGCSPIASRHKLKASINRLVQSFLSFSLRYIFLDFYMLIFIYILTYTNVDWYWVIKSNIKSNISTLYYHHSRHSQRDSLHVRKYKYK